MNEAVFHISLGGTADQHAGGILFLEKIILSRPDRIIVKLLGGGGLHPEAALAFIDLLALLPAECERIACSYTSFAGAGDFALWLKAGDIRDFRPNAMVWVPSLPSFSLADARLGAVLVEDRSTFPDPVFQWAYGRCIELISEYVDPSTVLDRVLTAADLRDWLLIDSHALDEALAKSNAHDHEATPLDPGGPTVDDFRFRGRQK